MENTPQLHGNNQQVSLITEKELKMHLENIGIAKNLTEGETSTFLQIAKAYNLNPFKKEIHVSKRGDQMVIIVGYESYLKRAERLQLLNGWKVTFEGAVEDASLKAIITIHRKDWTIPFVHEVYYSEYVEMVDEWIDKKPTGKKRPTKFWQKAHTMTGKVAMSQGFRLCFPDELGGMPPTHEELNDIEEGTVTVIDPKKEETKTGEKENQLERYNEYHQLVSGCGHIATQEEMIKWLKGADTWNCKKISDATEKLLILIKERENSLQSKAHEQKQANQLPL